MYFVASCLIEYSWKPLLAAAAAAAVVVVAAVPVGSELREKAQLLCPHSHLLCSTLKDRRHGHVLFHYLDS